MTLLKVQGTGTVQYGGPQNDIHIIEFETSGPAALTIADYYLRDNPDGVIQLSVLGSQYADRVKIQMTGSLLDVTGLSFGAGWSAAKDFVFVLDTGLSDVIKGTALTDQIVLTGGSDSVRGGTGTDTLELFYQNKSEDFTSIAPGQLQSSGGDLVQFAGMERLIARLGSGDDHIDGLEGNDQISGGLGEDELRGFAGNDQIFGEGDNDDLYGGDGSDLLDGGGGFDLMVGGTGDDTYIIKQAGDQVVESAGQGNDTIRSAIDIDLLGTRVENAILIGDADASAAGNDTRNLLVGNDGDNFIYGGQGRDDIRVGGDAGDDTIYFASVAESTGTGRDILRGFDASAEDDLTFNLTPTQQSGFLGDSVVTHTGGRLSASSFDADIAAALNPVLTSGGLTQAVLWDPTSGDQNGDGQRYLVVDTNNDGSYTAGLDHLVQLLNMTGTLDTGDLNFVTV